MEIEPAVGGRWAMGGFDVENSVARIVELEPDRRVVLDWGSMVSTWELEGSEGQTRLTFVHSGFTGHPPYAGWIGWLAGASELRRFHEMPGWRPMWVEYGIPGTPEGVLAETRR
jgi:Activator of Hsp90 ATPase homolog 1-like protein